MENNCKSKKYCSDLPGRACKEHLQNNKSAESFLRTKSATSIFQSLSNDKNTYQMLMRKLEDYYAVYDLDNGTSHKDIFCLLYTSNKNMRYEKIAQQFFLDVRTLKRYVAKYKELARRLLSCGAFKPDGSH